MQDVPRGYRFWVGASTLSQVGDGALYLALGWAASAHGGAAVGLVLASITVPRTPGGCSVVRWSTVSGRVLCCWRPTAC